MESISWLMNTQSVTFPHRYFSSPSFPISIAVCDCLSTWYNLANFETSNSRWSHLGAVKPSWVITRVTMSRVLSEHSFVSVSNKNCFTYSSSEGAKYKILRCVQWLWWAGYAWRLALLITVTSRMNKRSIVIPPCQTNSSDFAGLTARAPNLCTL